MNKANRIVPYILPIITIIIISIVMIAKPSITGFAVSELGNQESKLIKISSTIIIPEGSIVEIIGSNKTLTLTIEEFIQKSGKEPEYQYGEIKEIDYSGKGYTGEYTVNMGKLNLDSKQTYIVYILYKDIIISEIS